MRNGRFRRLSASRPAPRSPRSRPAPCSRSAFAVIAGAIAAKLLFGRDSWQLGDELPGRGPMLATAIWSGSPSLMGVSGGSLSNMILTLYGKSIHRAVATSAGLGVPIAVAGTIGFMLAGLPHQAEMPPFSHRLRVGARLRRDGADLELRRRLRRAARPRHPEAAARDHLRAVPGDHVGAVPGEPVLRRRQVAKKGQAHGLPLIR